MDSYQQHSKRPRVALAYDGMAGGAPGMPVGLDVQGGMAGMPMGPVMGYGMGAEGHPRGGGPMVAMPGGPDMIGGAGGFGAMGGGGAMGSEWRLPCVKLRGLPFETCEDDIIQFLGLEPIDILMVRKGGRFSGEAFVVFGMPMQVEAALAKNKMHLGRRYIEVFRAKKVDYYKAVAAEVMDSGPMPYMHDQSRPVQPGPGGGMDHGYGQALDGAAPDAGPGGMGGGPGMAGMGGMGGSGMPLPAAVKNDPPTTVLRLRGLPFSASPEEIAAWLNEGTGFSQPLLANRILLVMSRNGRPAGMAYAEFATVEDADRCMAKHKQRMGHRYIEIFASSPEEMASSRERGGF